MSHVPELAREQLAEFEPIFQAAERSLGFLPHALLIMARRPPLLEAFGGLMMQLHGPGPLPEPLKWLVAMAASHGAACSYCEAHCAVEIATRAGGPERAAALGDYRSSPLFSDAERAAIGYAIDASATPSRVTDAHHVALREHFDHDAIVDITGIIAIMGFLNRWNAALAVTLEDAPLALASEHLTGRGWTPGPHRPVGAKPT